MFSIDKNKFNIKSISSNFLKTIFILFISTSAAFFLVETSKMKYNILGIYMLAIAIISSITPGYIWGILASFAGIIGVNYFFTFPYYAINFTLSGYPFNFVIMLIISCLISALTAKIKRQAIIASTREKRAKALYDINKKLLSTTKMEEIIQLALKYFHTLFQCSVIIYDGHPAKEKHYKMKLNSPLHKALFLSKIEKTTASNAYTEKSMTGLGTEIMPHSTGIYVPLVSNEKIYGVVGLILENKHFLEPENIHFLELMISQLILAIERQILSDKQKQILVETEKEKMRSNLLRAVSHDLRTPLTCISGASATLLENKHSLNELEQKKLLSDIHQDSQWLIHMVENLLSVTKISGKTTKISKVPEAVEEVIAETITKIKKRFPNCQLKAQIPSELFMVPMDATLIEQVLINFLENAIRHSQTKEPILINVQNHTDCAWFEVADRGIGICEEELPFIFDSCLEKNTTDSTRGLGVGLSICKSIILAHNGTIEAKNQKNGGAVFRFKLPLEGDDSV